jgi:hypothetical protein
MDPSWNYFDWFLAFGKLLVMLLAQIGGVSGGLGWIGVLYSGRRRVGLAQWPICLRAALNGLTL